MKKRIFGAIVVLALVSITQIFGALHFSDSLNSTTYIEANQSFVLGEGKHGSYSAKVINKGNVDVEVFSASENEERKPLGVLKPKDKSEYNVPKNKQVIFKNLGARTAVIGISISGETSLSMNYKKNQK